MIKKTLSIALIAGSLVVGNAQAAEQEGSKEGLIGMGSGAIAGALIGGPVGMGIGAIIGTIIGDSVHVRGEIGTQSLAHQASLDAVQSQLADTRRQNGSLQAERSRLREEIAQRPEPPRLDGSLALDVLFRTGSDQLEPVAVARLAELGSAIKGLGDLRIRLEGHTDLRGAEDANLALSAQRLAAVKQALTAAGVPAERIEANSLGEAQARAAAGDTDGLALDRRVAIHLNLEPEAPRQHAVSLNR